MKSIKFSLSAIVFVLAIGATVASKALNNDDTKLYYVNPDGSPDYEVPGIALCNNNQEELCTAQFAQDGSGNYTILIGTPNRGERMD